MTCKYNGIVTKKLSSLEHLYDITKNKLGDFEDYIKEIKRFMVSE